MCMSMQAPTQFDSSILKNALIFINIRSLVQYWFSSVLYPKRSMVVGMETVAREHFDHHGNSCYSAEVCVKFKCILKNPVNGVLFNKEKKNHA